LKTEIISTKELLGKPAGSVLKNIVLENEVKDVLIEFISIKENYKFEVPAQSDILDVLLTIAGECVITTDNENHKIDSSTIARVPFNKNYSIRVKDGKEFSFIRLKKLLK